MNLTGVGNLHTSFFQMKYIFRNSEEHPEMC